MKVTYGVIQEIYSLNGNTRISYGIAAYANADKDGSATVVEAVHDITSDEARLQTLSNLCNSLELSAIHLRDVVEDFLNSCSELRA